MNLSFFLREVWRSLGRNAVPSFAAMASVLVTMLVLGAFIPVMQMASTAADQTRDRIYVSAFLKTDATKADIVQRVRERIMATGQVEKLQFLTPDQARAEMVKSDPKAREAFTVLGKSNPLPPTFRITPKDPDKIPELMAALAPTNASGVQSPVDPKIDELRNASQTPKLASLMNAVKWGVGLLALLWWAPASCSSATPFACRSLRVAARLR